ncbi:MAG: AraC family transcriptional regulator [Clostridia bacterium]|nr:AraC family transcriptional regulator [Clostridia bacterium]
MKLFSNYLQKPDNTSSEITNWQDNCINDSLLYSYRDTSYSRKTYPSNMHYHDYYEIIIIEEGDISYVCESSVYFPTPTDIVVIPPRKLHMSKINSDFTRYKRHVFYLYPDAFDNVAKDTLVSFMTTAQNGALFKFSTPDDKAECMNLLGKLKTVLNKKHGSIENALGYAYIIELFCLLNQRNVRTHNEIFELPQSILEIKSYLDENFAEISSVTEIAEHFFYSREYVSRLFKKHFDTTVIDYIHKRRISESQKLIANGSSVIDACYKVGFGSLSSFIRVFKEITDMKPSEYRSLTCGNTQTQK